ncbi:DUF4238 domain-containing protein [Flavobacterium bizetiae]|nr:DUF4238 domain-containing protein [Flavobacterium bizetiae]
MNKSKRHHYVPKFMTKNFSTDKGLIYVYDKISDKFFESNSINLFLENDRNTFVNLEGINDDIIEQVYSSVDTMFGGVLTEITTTNQISDLNFKKILLLAYISKWRVPQYDEAFQKAKEAFSINDLGFGLKNDKDEKLDFDLEEHFQLDMQQELKRILLAIQPFRFKGNFKTLLENSFLVCSPINSFIGDCPFNEATIISEKIFEDFVFPVTKDLTMVFSTRINRDEIQNFLLNGEKKKIDKFLIDFSNARDVSTLHLAQRNVACCDKDHLEKVVEIYKRFVARGNNTSFNLTVFQILYKFTEYAST